MDEWLHLFAFLLVFLSVAIRPFLIFLFVSKAVRFMSFQESAAIDTFSKLNHPAGLLRGAELALRTSTTRETCQIDGRAMIQGA